MKKTILYAIVILVVLVVLVAGWYIFSPVGLMICGPCGCFNDQCGSPRTSNYWKCTDTKTYTCPSGTTNTTCSGGALSCVSCTYYMYKYYYVTLTAVANKNVNGTTVPAYIYDINGESVSLAIGERHSLSDATIFGVTSSIAFYLQSTIETKVGSVMLPPPSSTTVELKVPGGGGCSGMTYYCSSWYVPSCSGNTLICTKTTNQCSVTKPAGSCTLVGKC